MEQNQDMENVHKAMTDERELPVKISVKDAWLLVSGLQLVCRHPEISSTMKNSFVDIALKYQAAIKKVHPQVDGTLEKGWHTEFDVDDQGMQVNEWHQAWTIYGMDGDQVSDTRLATISRPQDWGDPRWTYRPYVFHQWGDNGEHVIYHTHCWTDLKLKSHEMAELFSGIITKPMYPGMDVKLCGDTFLHPEDFWLEEWGDMPPIHDPYVDGDFDF